MYNFMFSILVVMDQIKYITILLNFLLHICQSLNNDYMFKVLEEFHINHPFMIHTKNYFPKKIIRNLFLNSQFCGNIEKIQDQLELGM